MNELEQFAEYVIKENKKANKVERAKELYNALSLITEYGRNHK